MPCFLNSTLRKMKIVYVASFLVFLAVPASAASVRGSASGGELASSGSSHILEPLHVNQRFLFCNAYTSDSVAIVRRHDHALFDAGVPFKACRYSSTSIKTHDKLQFDLAGVGAEGTFEVGALPDDDAVLLLVIERRDVNSTMIGFQSFALPSSDSDHDAQLAVIDTFRGSTVSAHLKMADHVGKGKAVSKRVELLNFNRVYSVEEGAYDASVEFKTSDAFGKILHLKKKEHYIIMRTGDDGKFGQSLVVFPEAGLQSRAPQVGRLLLTLVSLLFVCC